MSDAPAQQRLVDHIEEFRRTLGVGWDDPSDWPPDEFIPLSSLGPQILCVGGDRMIPLRFLPSISVDRDTAAGILDNLVRLDFITDATRLRNALDRFFAVRDWGFLVPSRNDVEGWKGIQRRYVQPLRHRGGQLAAVLAEISDAVKDSICSTPAAAPSGPQAAADESAAATAAAGKGVSLLDAALVLTEEDRALSIEKKKAWQKLRTPQLPCSVGYCPNHRQVKLFAPSALADFLEKVESEPLCRQHKLRQRLAAKAREPRQR